jgi:hypothetical protein
MKLLITDNQDASKEIKAVLPFLDADIKYKNFAPDMETATNDVIGVIGQAVYNFIADKYPITAPVDHENVNQNLVRAAKKAIYAKTYIYFAPNNDLSHTSDGRKMRNEEHEKNAFQWMIDADNEAQEKRYYRALDDLIKLLDSTKTVSESPTTIWTIWTTSEEYKTTQSFFIRNTKQFDKYIVIESPYLFYKLCPGIDECETDEILPRIGKTKFDEIKTKLKTPTDITDPKDIKLLELIRRACANYSFAWGIDRFSIALLPDSVVQKYTSDRASTKASAPALKMEPQGAIEAYMATFDKTVSKIEDLLKEVPEDLSTIPTSPKIADVSGGFNAM